MHELSIANAIVAEVEAAAKTHTQQNGDHKTETTTAAVVSVTLSVGRLCGVVPGALQFGFEIAREGTLLSQAALIIEIDPVVVWCPEGEHTLELDGMIFRCPEHKCATPEILSGKDMLILRFELASSTTPAVAVTGVSS